MPAKSRIARIAMFNPWYNITWVAVSLVYDKLDLDHIDIHNSVRNYREHLTRWDREGSTVPLWTTLILSTTWK